MLYHVVFSEMLKLSNQIESFVISDFMEEQQVYCTHQVAEAAPRPHTTLCRCSLGCCCCCCFARRPVRGKASSLLLDGTVKAQAEQLPCYSEQCDVRSHVSLVLSGRWTQLLMLLMRRWSDNDECENCGEKLFVAIRWLKISFCWRIRTLLTQIHRYSINRRGRWYNCLPYVI